MRLQANTNPMLYNDMDCFFVWMRIVEVELTVGLPFTVLFADVNTKSTVDMAADMLRDL